MRDSNYKIIDSSKITKIDNTSRLLALTASAQTKVKQKIRGNERYIINNGKKEKKLSIYDNQKAINNHNKDKDLRVEEIKK